MTRATPLLTFVVAVRNAQDTIARTLRGFQAQTRTDWTAVIIDDGSTDGTLAAARAVADPRITVVPCPPGGVASARNLGLSLARTPLVCVTDGDDVHEPVFFATLAAAIGRADLATSAFRYAGPGLEDSGWVHVPAQTDTRTPAILELNQFALGAIVGKLDSLLALAPLPSRGAAPEVFPPDSHVEDWDVLVRADAAGLRWAPIVPEPLFSYRLRPASRTTGLRPLWLDGLTLIRSRTLDPGPARRWTLRSLARAAVMGDQGLAKECTAALGTLTDADTDTLAGALGFAVRRSLTAREPGLPNDRDGWSARIIATIGDSPPGRAACARAALAPRRWHDVAAAAAARLAPGQTLAVYGLGRNGRAVIEALPRQDVPVVGVDDALPTGSGGLARPVRIIRPDDLGPQHLVLVTPDVRDDILRRLRGRVLAGILLPEHLAA